MSKTAEQLLKHSNDEKEQIFDNKFITRDVSISHWEKGRVLGRGSYGVVYLGVPTKPHLAHVAIKVAPLNKKALCLIKENVILEKFIGCPEIVQCMGYAIIENRTADADRLYNLVLEYAAGGTLADLINARTKLPEQDVKQYLRMMLRGLSRVHAKSYVHSDLKPDNILVFPSEKTKLLKIADFGLSNRYKKWKYYFKEEEEDHKLKIRGTLRYMSPESLHGKIKPSLDIWSLGCILVNMISGKHVWDDCTNNKQVISKLLNKKMPSIPKELSNQGKDFLRKCFERNHEQRWSADMLLKHPYLVEETTNSSFQFLPTFIGFCTIMILVLVFCGFFFNF